MSWTAKIKALVLLVVLALGGLVVLRGDTFFGDEKEQEKITYCTADAMQCPDGSYVGRTGPNCEFVCPLDDVQQVLVGGVVTLSPTCPVEQVPPHPSCAPRGYETTVEVRNRGQLALLASTETDASGRFNIRLAPGQYDVIAVGKNPYPRCDSKTIVVGTAAITLVELSCDTGIR